MRGSYSFCKMGVSAGFFIMTAAAGDATQFDMRDCALDRLIFVDPWSGARFEPNRIGKDTYYTCGENEQIVRSSSDLYGCRGPYGDIFLEGIFRDNGSEKSFLAMYSYHKGTVPCCGWSVFASDTEPDIYNRVIWLKPGKAPKLKEWPFAGIVNSWGKRSELDGIVALICISGTE